VTSPWVLRLGGFLSVLVLVGSLVFLQVLNAQKDLLFCFVAYAGVAIAALLATVTMRSSSSFDLLCVCASAVFFGYIMIRALTSPAPYIARPDLYSVLAGLTLYGLTLSVLTGSAVRIALIVSLLGFAVVHVLVSVVQAGLGENYNMIIPSLGAARSDPRATGLYVNPNHLAGLLEVLGIFALSITCWSRWPSWAKVFLAYLAGICYFGVVLTGSRAGYLSVVASLLIFAVLSLLVLRSGGTALLLRFGGSGLILLTTALIAAGLTIHHSAPLRERVQNIVPDEGRLDLWRAAIEQWKLQPVTGTGSGTYLFYGRQFRSEQMQLDPVDVHNDYLHLLCEYGLIGAAGFLLFFCAHLYRGWQTFMRLGPRRLAAGSYPLSDRLALNIGALCAIGAYVVHSAVDYNLHIPANALLFAFIFGIVANPGMAPGSEISRPTSTRISRFAVVVLGTVLLLQCARLLPGEFYGERARTALEDEDPSSAISLARKALAHEEQNPNIFFYLGRALLALGNEKDRAAERPSYYDGALAAFQKARRLVPLDGTYPLEMAFAYDQIGRFAEAESMYDIARARDPRSIAIAQLYQAHLESRKNGEQKGVDKTAITPRD